MMKISILVLLAFGILLNQALARGKCAALKRECVSNLEKGKPCPLLPVPKKSIQGPIDPQGFNLTELRPGVFWYNDGLYNNIILFKNRRLAVVDFPQTTTSVAPDGTYLLIPAIKKVLRGAVPKRFDMIYGHRHMDHIGNAGLVHEFATKAFPGIQLFVWGTSETREFIRKPEMSSIPDPNVIVGQRGRTLQLAPSLKVKLLVVGGHTNTDLAAYVLPSNDGPGVLHYVDSVTPKAAPFVRFALTLDLEQYIKAQERLLELDFKFFTAGHGLLGTKEDIRVNIKYTKFVVQAARDAGNEARPQDLARLFQLRADPAAPQFGNTQFLLTGIFDLFTDICERKVIKKWGCALAGVDLLASSHCSSAVFFNTLDFQMATAS